MFKQNCYVVQSDKLFLTILTESANVWPSMTKAGTWPIGFNSLYSDLKIKQNQHFEIAYQLHGLKKQYLRVPLVSLYKIFLGNLQWRAEIKKPRITLNFKLWKQKGANYSLIILSYKGLLDRLTQQGT